MKTFITIKKKVSSVLVICLLISMIACEEKIILTINNPKIKSELINRQKIFRDAQLAKCRLDVIESAQNYVDSLISTESVFRINDSIVFPEKPIKPQSLGPITINDTLRAKPIFKK